MEQIELTRRLNLLFATLSHLKPTQVYYQIFYRIKKKLFRRRYEIEQVETSSLVLQKGISCLESYKGSNTFCFLNLEKAFSRINWNYSENGKLWTYNLNYFEFLNQEKLTREEGIKLIEDFISQSNTIRDGLEPYPISLRGINWIKFLSKHKIINSRINELLFRDYRILMDHLEYHLMANHLLENGFSLLFGAYYFRDEKIYTRAKEIVTEELQEQILKDGAHYELSPMYHQIILHRVLDSLNLVQHNDWKKGELCDLLKEKAEAMLGWLEKITFKNGEIPKVNDAATGIAPSTNSLKDYATRLGLEGRRINLMESGYRKFESDGLEILMDVGNISPKYQPGHSHADSLQFLLNYKNRPIVVDTGISTYEKNNRRQFERSTFSHNTISINEKNSSEVWGGFRVGRRAKVTILEDAIKGVTAFHDGYRKLGIFHERRFKIFEKQFFIIDQIRQTSSIRYKAKGNVHFHPDVELENRGNSFFVDGELEVVINGAEKVEIKEYLFSEGYNKLVKAKKIEYLFWKRGQVMVKPVIFPE